MATMVAVWVSAVPALVASPNWNTWPFDGRLPVAAVVTGGHQAHDLGRRGAGDGAVEAGVTEAEDPAVAPPASTRHRR